MKRILQLISYPYRADKQQVLLQACIAQLESIISKCTGFTPPEVDLVKVTLSLTFHSMQLVISSDTKESTGDAVLLESVRYSLRAWCMKFSASVASWQNKEKDEAKVSVVFLRIAPIALCTFV